MTDLSAGNTWYKRKAFVLLIFCCVTLIMLFSRYLSFSTFKGSDDLHYAFLSSKVLHGTYDMFFAQDIYAGRTLVILYQVLWFKLFGVNDFSVYMPSVSVLIMLAYLVCFRSGLKKDAGTVILASSLIYFNPVVTRSTLGNLPDVYIALIALLVFLLIRKNIEQLSAKRHMFSGFITGLLLLAGLFVKENIVLIYAGAAIVLFYYRKTISRSYILPLAATFFIGIAGYLLFYYINTGDFFYRFVQIKNAAYFNECSYKCLPGKVLLKRLTITVPLVAVLTGAYPLLLLVAGLFNKNVNTSFFKVTFVSLLLLALYFPFSVSPYVPLCHDMRQFFFLFPFATILFISRLQENMMDEKRTKKVNISGAIVFALITATCVYFASYNKWAILCHGILALLFVLNMLLNKRMWPFSFYLLMPCILWLSTAYTIFKKPYDGYKELKAMQSKLKEQSKFNTNTYYFLNNDTKTNFALLNRFDMTRQFLNFDTLQKGFKPFAAYQSDGAINNTESGWLIVSDAYMENIKAADINSIKQLLGGRYFSLAINKTTAYYLTPGETVQKIIRIINTNSAGGNCY